MTRRASTLNGTDSGISREIGVQYANVKIVAEHIDTIIELAELNLTAVLDGKVDKVAGKELSDNNYTDDEKTKLAGLEGTHFKGEFVSLPALQTAWSVASVGDYANVDTGIGSDVLRFVWDDSDQKWVEQIGVSTQLTGSQIKIMYEDQPDTNAFTDTEKAKLAAYSSTPLSGSTSVLIDVATRQIRTQAVTGDVSIPQNGVVATITNKAVSNTKLADMAGDTVKGKVGTAGTPTDLTPTDLRTMLNVAAGATVGADWNTNLSNIPAPLVGITTTGASLLQTLSLVTISFPRMNADRTVTYLSASDLLAAISGVSLDTAQTITGSKTFSAAVSVASLGSSGTIGAAGAITSGTSVGAPAMSGGTANFGTYSGGPAVLTGTSQLDFLGLGTSSLGSDRLRVNGTSTFYGHAVVNGNVTATNLIGAGSGITGLTKSQVGLSNVDNTSDVNKPISSAVQTEFNTRLGTSGNLGTLAQQNANAVVLTGGTADNLVIGGTTRAAARVTSIDVSTDLTLSGTSRKILGNFQGSSISSRTLIQSNVADTATRVTVVPNGTATIASFEAFFSSTDPDNSSGARVTATSADIRLESIISGTGSYLPLNLYNGGAIGLTIAINRDVSVVSDFSMTGSGKRFKADFSNATVGSRTSFQSSTTNGNTIVNFLPNGTATTTALNVYNSSDTTNHARGTLSVDTAKVQLRSEVGGSGTQLPIEIFVNGAVSQYLQTDGTVKFPRGSVTIDVPSGQSSLYLSQAGTVNGRIYAAGGAGTDVVIDANRFITLNPTSNFSVNYAGVSKLSVSPVGDTVVAGSMTAANFYGNGFNLTQLNASEVKNGLLPSNIFPSTISAATITFAGAITIKGGGSYNRLVLDNTDTTLRNINGNSVFNASATDLSVQRDGNITLSASSTTTQLFSRTGNIAAVFDASTSQLHGPGGAPFVQASTSVTKLNAASGAPSIEIDSSGSAMIKFPQYLVSTKPSASANSQRVIIISDAALGYGLYISDGTNWRSAQTGTVQA
jgi:hypothetical protein